jgi:hypothetical protein
MHAHGLILEVGGGELEMQIKNVLDFDSFTLLHVSGHKSLTGWFLFLSMIVPGTFFPGIKRLGREVDHSPLSGAEVKNAWSYISTPPIGLHGVVLS